jgi:PiT family inorganic phosphate transporter
LGTFFGGWRSVKTMAFRLTDKTLSRVLCWNRRWSCTNINGFVWHSGKHHSCNFSMDVGAAKRLSAVRWGTGMGIIYA